MEFATNLSLCTGIAAKSDRRSKRYLQHHPQTAVINRVQTLDNRGGIHYVLMTRSGLYAPLGRTRQVAVSESADKRNREKDYAKTC